MSASPDIDAGTRFLPFALHLLPEARFLRHQTGLAYILDVRPTRRAMQVFVRFGGVGQYHLDDSQDEEPEAGRHHADAAGTHECVQVQVVPFAGPAQDSPREVAFMEVGAKGRMISEIAR